MLRGYESHSLRRRSRIKPLLRLLRLVALAVLAHTAVTRLAVFSLRIDSVSMEPALARGDRVLATPLAFGVPIAFLPARLRSYGAPARGDLVVFELPGSPRLSRYAGFGETLLRFFTFNSCSMARGPDGRPVPRYSIKRVIGLPGETVRMQRLRAWVRPPGHPDFHPEHELASQPYAVSAEPVAAWPEGLPFGGDAGDTALGEDEIFVLGDNRARSSDSRSWDAVPLALVRGRVLFRYWPVRRIGRP